ncbi:MAG: hypothetical protein KIT56_04435 [Gammaproteobacteria bacterium]|nr:hypothetical protein [Gammaproteobacteria bacterium]MCW5583125.1 hypothetical protein [Gammaproteobacteria bacterium]
MAASTKVFIYNAQGADQESVNDLKELFTTSKKIFPHSPDVQENDFNFNLSGLSNPTFVVPGGSSMWIGIAIKPVTDKIKFDLDGNFNYVGICAGAFIGTENAYLSHANHTLNLNSTFNEPSFLYTTQEIKTNLAIISDYEAAGAFYPNDSHINTPQKKMYMPYRVNLSLQHSNQRLEQLYVAGPGFIPLAKQSSEQPSEVVATYADRESYTLNYNKTTTKTMDSLPAMIRKKPQGKQGGIFLSGTHIETCVKGSKLLKFFETSTKDGASLSKTDYETLENEQDKARDIVESLLGKTLNKAG